MAITSPKSTSKSSNKTKQKLKSKKAVVTTKATVVKPVSVKPIKPVTVPAPTTKKTGRVITDALIERFHRSSAVIYLLLAVVAALIMNDTAFAEFISHLTSDALRSTNQTTFVPAITVLYEVPVKWLVVTLLLFSAIFSFVRSRRYIAREAAAVASGLVPRRWLDFGVSSVLIIYILALITGIQDILIIKLLGGMFILAAGLGWIADRENNAKPGFIRGAYWGGVFAAALPILILAMTSLATAINGMVRSPWYVYATHAVFILGLILWYRNQRRSYRIGAVPAATEYRYLWISYATKVLLVIVLILGFQK